MQLNIVIRPAQEADAPVLSDLICKNAAITLAPHYSKLQMDTFLSYYSPAVMREKIDRQSVFCACEANQILGTIALDGDFVVGFYTHPGYMNRGIGLLMLQYLEQFAREKGLNEIQLASSPAATSFYLKNGYVKVEDCVFTYLGVAFEETLMVKKLLDESR